MAFIKYLPADQIPATDQVADQDHIIQVHGVNSPVMKLHLNLYAHLMRGPGPLDLVQREMVATAVSNLNGCHY